MAGVPYDTRSNGGAAKSREWHRSGLRIADSWLWRSAGMAVFLSASSAALSANDPEGVDCELECELDSRGDADPASSTYYSSDELYGGFGRRCGRRR